MLKDALPSMITATFPGPKAEDVLERRGEAIPSSIKYLYPCVIKQGAGAMIEDVDGNILLDWVGGVGVLNIGHTHPEVVEVVKAQSEKFFHGMVNIVTHEGYVKLAEEMNDLVPVRGVKKKTMFANSGAEAVENAIKIAKGYTKRPNIIVFSGAFHGRTHLTISMTAKKAYSKGLGPFPEGVYRADYPYLYRKPEGMTDEAAIDYYVERLKRVFDESSLAEYVAAIVFEPLQGEGGFVPAPLEWVKAVRKLCDENNILLIADEVQTGFGRTGRMFASNYWKEAGCEPDIITSAKSIAAGLPLSAITARAEIFDAMPPSTLGGTYGGNAIATAAALKVIEIIKRDKLCERSLQIGERCYQVFHQWKETFKVIGDVRGLGGMIGIEFVKDRGTKEPYPEFVTAVMKECARTGLLIEPAGTYGNVIRFLAPLVITDAQLEAGFAIMEAAMKKVYEVECL